MSKGYTPNKKKRWRSLCAICYDKKRKGHSLFLIGLGKYKCHICGFIAIHPCQLDIDHIDGNQKNNDKGNIQILCANCHRLKTFSNKDWEIFGQKLDEYQLELF